MAKSSKKAEVAMPTSEESTMPAEAPAGDGVGASPDVQQPDVAEAEQITVKLSIDAAQAAHDLAAAADEFRAFNIMRELEAQAGAEFHGIHQRFAEMIQFLPRAIENADGALKLALSQLLDALTK